MDFEVYCDESGLEAINKKDEHKFSSIGGIWLPASHRESLKEGLKTIKDKHGILGELKWKKLSPAYFELYKDVIDFFFSSEFIRFRVILVESSKIDHIRFNNMDSELGFYKFYYQLLHHWIYDFNSYNIFVDLKINRYTRRLTELRKVLDLSNLTSDIRQVQGLPSEQSLGIQLADILTGLAASKFNGEIKEGSAKSRLIDYLEQVHINKELAPTPKWEEKFNIFRINLQGGW
ncbi:MAG: DUF3800 domain-containing protein [Candidatus Cyclobacteriaceae bacterium M2_1C_046]